MNFGFRKTREICRSGGKVQELKCLDPGMGVSVNDIDGWNSEQQSN